jgi:DNA-binding MarR family transcriptional regulator
MSRRSRKDELVSEIGLLFRASQNYSDSFDRAAGEALGVNMTDLHCLDVVQRLGGATAGELARELGLTTGAVTAVVDRMERAGFLRRVRDPEDRRRVIIELTVEGLERAAEIYGPPAEEWEAHMRRFTTDQLEVVAEFMRTGNEVARSQLERIRRQTDGDGA